MKNTAAEQTTDDIADLAQEDLIIATLNLHQRCLGEITFSALRDVDILIAQINQHLAVFRVPPAMV
jgi:hypothetical protein